jgi:predicted membrane protein
MNSDGLDIMKCYEVLDIRPGATISQVRKAYLELAHVWDPDQHINNPPLRLVSEQKRKEIDAAYNALHSFLPDLRPKTDDPEHPVPNHAERPADAVEDMVPMIAAPQTPMFLYVFLTALIMAALFATGFFMWHSVNAANNRSALDVAEEK